MTEPLPYETKQPNNYRWTSEAFDLLVAKRLEVEVDQKHGIRTVSLTGPCPRCKDEVNFHQILDGISGEQPGTLSDMKGVVAEPATTAPTTTVVALTAACQCGEEHPGRPDGVSHGCGINFNVTFEIGLK